MKNKGKEECTLMKNIEKGLNLVFENLSSMLNYKARIACGKIYIFHDLNDASLKEAFEVMENAIKENVGNQAVMEEVVTGLNMIVEELSYYAESNGFGYTDDDIFAITGDDIDGLHEGLNFLLSELREYC